MGGPYWSSYPSTSGRPMERPSNPTELVSPALQHLRRVFPHLQDVEPVLIRPKLHIECIPTYLPDHGGRLRELHEAISSGPWKHKLSLVGSGYGGIGVNDCVGSAEEVVDALAQGHSATGLERWADWS
jgi:oxygen-dependent protoporphyrinogen oxidase